MIIHVFTEKHTSSTLSQRWDKVILLCYIFNCILQGGELTSSQICSSKMIVIPNKYYQKNEHDNSSHLLRKNTSAVPQSGRYTVTYLSEYLAKYINLKHHNFMAFNNPLRHYRKASFKPDKMPIIKVVCHTAVQVNINILIVKQKKREREREYDKNMSHVYCSRYDKTSFKLH